MGYYKELEIERMQDPLFDVPNIIVGVSCFGNQLIISYIKRNGKVDICHYTGRKELTISLKVILRYILDIINEYFTDPVNEAGWDRHLDEEGSVPGFIKMGDGYVVPQYKAHYEYTEDLLQCEGLETSCNELYQDIVGYLPENMWVEKDLYGLNDSEIKSIDWQEIVSKAPRWIEQDLTYDKLPIADKNRLFQLLADIQIIDNLTVKEMPIKLYRTVKYKNPLSNVIFSDITSAPSNYASANRMSKQGESMFYGASTSNCSQIESIGDDSAVFYVGEFESIRPLVLMDLRHVRQRLSIFDITQGLYYTACFLNSFCETDFAPNRWE